MTSNKVLYLIAIALCFIEVGNPGHCFQKMRRKRKNKICKEIKINMLTLEKVLNNYLSEDMEIDFLSVDVKGLDFQVLASNDWGKYRPNIVLIEDLYFSLIVR